MENFKIADFTLDFFRLEKSSRDFQRFWHIRKVKPNFSRYLPSRSESLVVLHCFLETAKSFFPRFGTAFALYVGRDQKDSGLFEKIEVHFPVSTVLVKWYLPEKFIPQYYFYAGCRVIVSTIIWKKETVSTVSDGYFIILKL